MTMQTCPLGRTGADVNLVLDSGISLIDTSIDYRARGSGIACP
ncbi:MAG: hypothetical protein ACRDRJ_01780 [Streptosporangiaceae bacterium]